jgi:hypothetical protein
MTVDSARTHSWEERLLRALRSGPQSLEQLCVSSGLGMPELFLAVDCLSRSGRLFVRRTADWHYVVSAEPIPR